MFNEVRLNKVSMQIISQIRELIFSGRLSPGDRLYPEASLMEQFGVSKQSLKEALRALEYIGLLEIKKGVGGGAYVVEMDREVIREVLASFLFFKKPTVHNLSEVRMIVEPYTARLAAERITEQYLERLGMLVAEDRMESKEYDSRCREIDMEFHRGIAIATRNPILELVVDFIETIMMDLKKVIKPDTPFSLAVIEGHRRIFDALQNRDPKKASEEMERHLIEVENCLVELEGKIGLFGNDFRRA